MTIEERNIKLKHYITCLNCECSGKCCEPDCDIQFKAGNFGEIIENLDAISEILEQQPCEDCVSRQSVLDTIESWLSCDDYNEAERHIMRAMQSVLYDLPPVTPKQEPCDDCISRQAVLDIIMPLS